ncbi:hypothetical protein BB559_006322 [Furculomyces boomerangus]|uniref:Alpha/beta hydrolase fold-3 domain-containing protein n=1 Tax=Furculomyces boomerangus TaxID=61424 RepID=A0A2T9XXJ0_9FUNG|nr:hypothetical protein BB559_007395 [Furculomyces boomerangus]PVU86944.1 hypothetical protein BB559_006322 [Furculomyces boomerangus]
MAELGLGVLNSVESEEQRAILEEHAAKVVGASALKYFKEGPILPNWTLEFQLALDLVKVAYGATGTRGVRMTEENFDLEKILAGKGSPRESIVDVVVSESLVKRETSNGNGLDSILGTKPLSENETIFVHYHGGAYTRGSPGANRGLLLRIVNETGYRVFSPNYRLAPDNPFPAAIHDGYRFFQYLLSQGFRPENIIIAGSSAGGNLVMALALILKNANEKQPRGIIGFSPWTDLSHTKEASVENQKYDFIPASKLKVVLNSARLYAAPGRKLDEELMELLKHPFVSPAFGNFDECAPIYIISGQAEVLSKENARFAESIGAKEVVIVGTEHPGISATEKNIYENYVGMIHVFVNFEEANEGRAAIKGVGHFCRKLENQKRTHVPNKL